MSLCINTPAVALELSAAQRRFLKSAPGCLGFQRGPSTDAFIAHKQKWDLCKTKERRGKWLLFACFGSSFSGVPETTVLFRDSPEGLSEFSKAVIRVAVGYHSHRTAVRVSEGRRQWGTAGTLNCPHNMHRVSPLGSSLSTVHLGLGSFQSQGLLPPSPRPHPKQHRLSTQGLW